MATAKRVRQARKAARAARGGKGGKFPSPNPPGFNRHVNQVQPGGVNIVPAGTPIPKKPKRTVAQKATTKRGAAIGDLYPVCAPEALAASLRLQGAPVTDADVMDLFWWAGGDPEWGVTIQAAISAAGEHGLAGVRLAAAEMVEWQSGNCVVLGLALPAPHAVCATDSGWYTWGSLADPQEFHDAVIEEAWNVTWGCIRPYP